LEISRSLKEIFFGFIFDGLFFTHFLEKISTKLCVILNTTAGSVNTRPPISETMVPYGRLEIRRIFMAENPDLLKETGLENILTKFYKSEMVSHLKASPGQLEQLIRLALSDVPRYSWRATWMLWSCMEDNDPRVAHYVETILERLPVTCHSHQRELLKILYRMQLTEEVEGKLFDPCLRLWENTGNQPSVRYSALRLILKIIGKHPDLRNEVFFLTESKYLEPLSEGVKKSVARLVAGLKWD